jgi:hypothetical protein
MRNYWKRMGWRDLENISTGIHVFDENHHLVASSSPGEILSDHDLIHRCNLSHYHVRQAK